MKEIKAMIKPFMLVHVIEALREVKACLLSASPPRTACSSGDSHRRTRQTSVNHALYVVKHVWTTTAKRDD